MSLARSPAGGLALDLQGCGVRSGPGQGEVLRELSVQIAAGEQVALIGASGSGKTSLLLSLALALQPSAGGLSLDGVDPWRLGSRQRQSLRRRIFLAPQVPPLPPRQRVVTAVLAGRLPLQSLWASLRTLWHPASAEAALAQQALAALDLADKLWLRVDRLSGGERQRVGLARALVAQADLWLIDEPLSALDPTRAEQAIDALQQAARAEGRTLICSLHQVALARRCFPRVLALRDGRLVYDGPGSGLDPALLASLYGPALSDRPVAEAPPQALELNSQVALPGAMCR